MPISDTIITKVLDENNKIINLVADIFYSHHDAYYIIFEKDMTFIKSMLLIYDIYDRISNEEDTVIEEMRILDFFETIYNNTYMLHFLEKVHSQIKYDSIVIESLIFGILTVENFKILQYNNINKIMSDANHVSKDDLFAIISTRIQNCMGCIRYIKQHYQT